MERCGKNAAYLGLDIGSTSVGWAVSDETYRLCRVKGKDMWGVRLFEEAQTAAARRVARVQRRRYDRRNQRLALLQELFQAQIARVDPAFFQRMDAARLWSQDKPWKYTLFEQKGWTDREYHAQYPTVYHLRRALMTQDGPFDVRLVYLALHHILKKRGHFLYADLGDGQLPELEEIIRELELRFEDELGMELRCHDIDTLRPLLMDSTLSISARQKQLNAVFAAETKQQKTWVKALTGAKVKLSELYEDPTLEEAEQKEAEFRKAGYEDGLPVLEAVLGDRFALLEAWRSLYNWGVLQRLLGGASSISEAKVRQYEQNKKDLAELKAVLRADRTLYNRVFRATDVPGNYASIVGHAWVEGKKQTVKVCGHEDFCKFIEKVLDTLEQDERVQALRTRAKEGTLLPKLISGDNSVIPYQLHRAEMEQILDRAAVYLPFLKEKDVEGLTPADKIRALLVFRIPYYVGPLNPHSPNSWFVRKTEGPIYPWNFEDRVDRVRSAQAFIDRMTSSCTYLRGCDVLPACSPIYERFTVLNELNPMTVKGEPLSIELKQAIFEQVFLKIRKPGIRNIVGFLRAQGYDVSREDLGGIDVQGGVKSSLRTTLALQEILGEKYDDAKAEEIVLAATYFGDDRRLLREKLRSLGLTDDVIGRLLRLHCAGWGRLSRELLCEVTSFVPGQPDGASILDTLWQTNETLMGLLSDRYTFAEAIEARNREVGEESLYDFIDELYVSPSVKRQIRQTVLVARELRKVIGHDPKKIFIEMARGKEKKPERKPKRKQTLLACYETFQNEAGALYETLMQTDNQRLRQDKIYLYYTQMGRCMYSGERIDLEELLRSESLYDIDHIYPRSRVKDDSIDNRVLVKRTLNEKKGNDYPLSHEIVEGQRAFWSMLLYRKLISREKYERLTRRTGFTDEELTSFAARQLVETRQGTKAVAQLLGRMMPDSEIVYVKAGLVSDFRHARSLPKVRELNDLHHAKDAYLNIVVGNIYNTQFTHSPMRYICEHRDNYTVNLDSLLKMEIHRGGVLAWDPADGGSIATVRRTMARNSPLVTMMPVIYSGILFDLQPKPQGQGQMPLKKGLPIEKYGGYNKVTGACFMLVEHTLRRRRVRSLIDVPLHLYPDAVSHPELALRHCIEMRDLKEPRIILPIIRMRALLSLDGYKMYITGRTNGNLCIQNANQLMVSEEWEQYIKKIVKAARESMEYERLRGGEGYRPNPRDGLCPEKNLALYDLFVQKMERMPYCQRMSGQRDKLLQARAAFEALDVAQQCCILCQLLNLFSRVGGEADLTGIGLVKNFGILHPSGMISGCAQALLIHQSPTGLYERVVDLNRL